MKLLHLILLSISLLLSGTNTFAQPVGYNFYYGNLHSHTGYSDGSKDSASTGISKPYQAYNYAKASLNFDFLGISEHNHQSAGMILPFYHLGLQEADSANEDGSFVTLFGMEWGTISGGGHALVYGSNELLGWEPGNYDEFVANGDYQALWRKINARPGAFGMLCHPETSDFNQMRNGPFHTAADSAVVGSAFWSGPAFSTNITYSNQSNSSDEAYWKALLARGYHVGPTYDHDNHYTTFGRTTEGRLVALAPSLTRANLMTAFRNRNFYASDDWNTEVTLMANSQHLIGSIVYDLQPPSIQVTLADLDGESYTNFQLIKGRSGSGQNASVVTSGSAGAMAINYTDTNLQVGDSAYYYVSITQNDGDKILTSPIWYTRAAPVISAPETIKNEGEILIWPNPVNSTSGKLVSIATLVEGNLSVLDQLGRVVKTESVSSAGTILSTGNFAPGVYFLVFARPDKAPIIRRLMVQ